MIAIKGMEMPSDCMDCPLTYPRWDFNIGCKCCKAIIGHHEEYGEYKTTRHPDCPLVEIVTCKDCKHRDKVHPSLLSNKKDEVYFCTLQSDEYCYEVEDDYFCAFAERRE